jgi:hypothetical protein
MDEATVAVMARLDLVRDDVSDIKVVLREQQKEHSQHGKRLGDVEDSLGKVQENQQKILDGPVYSLDRFITKRVAQVTGGTGVLLYLVWTIIG